MCASRTTSPAALQRRNPDNAGRAAIAVQPDDRQALPGRQCADSRHGCPRFHERRSALDDLSAGQEKALAGAQGRKGDDNFSSTSRLRSTISKRRTSTAARFRSSKTYSVFHASQVARSFARTQQTVIRTGRRQLGHIGLQQLWAMQLGPEETAALHTGVCRRLSITVL
jgi:hypothetical protein